MGWGETCAETWCSWYWACLQIRAGLEVWEGGSSSGQQVGFFEVWVVVGFFPSTDLGNQAFSCIFVSTFLCVCAWETEPSICCCLCLEMGHEGDFSLIQYVPSSEPLQLTCPLLLRGCERWQSLLVAAKKNPLSGKGLQPQVNTTQRMHVCFHSCACFMYVGAVHKSI